MRKLATLAVLAAAVHIPAFGQAPAGDAARGKAAYMKHGCSVCHGTIGHGGDRGSGGRIAFDVWPWEAFSQAVRRPRESMPRYPVEHLSDAELADIYAYIAGQKRGPKASEIPLLKE